MYKMLVNEDAFRRYLERVLSSGRLVRDCISRCRRVEQSEGSLYLHYTNDKGRSLLERLSYSKDDADQGLEPRHSIIFEGNRGYLSIYEGTSSLKNAVQHYFEFLHKHN